MGPPHYVERLWRGEGYVEVHLDTTNGQAPQPTHPIIDKDRIINCYISSCFIRELERKCSFSDVGSNSEQEALPENDASILDTEVTTLPPGVSEELWQGWVEHWEAWKEVYVTLSWVHKRRATCKPDFVNWYDSYLADYPWILPIITQDLEMDEGESTQNSLCIETSVEEDMEGQHSSPGLGESDVFCLTSDHDTISLNSTKDHLSYQEESSVFEKDVTSDASISITCIDSENTVDSDGVNKENGSETIQETECVTDADKDEKSSNMDTLYESHSQQRYWVHLRSFLQESGIEANSDFEQYFVDKAGMSFTRHSECKISKLKGEYDNTINSEDDSQAVDDAFVCDSEIIPEDEIPRNGALSESEAVDSDNASQNLEANSENSSQGILDGRPVYNDTSEIVPQVKVKQYETRSESKTGEDYENKSQALDLEDNDISEGDDGRYAHITNGARESCLKSNDSLVNSDNNDSDADQVAVLSQKKFSNGSVCSDVGEERASDGNDSSKSDTGQVCTGSECRDDMVEIDSAQPNDKKTSGAKRRKRKKQNSRHTAGIGWALNFIKKKNDDCTQYGDQDGDKQDELKINGVTDKQINADHKADEQNENKLAEQSEANVNDVEEELLSKFWIPVSDKLSDCEMKDTEDEVTTDQTQIRNNGEELVNLEHKPREYNMFKLDDDVKESIELDQENIDVVEDNRDSSTDRIPTVDAVDKELIELDQENIDVVEDNGNSSADRVPTVDAIEDNRDSSADRTPSVDAVDRLGAEDSQEPTEKDVVIKDREAEVSTISVSRTVADEPGILTQTSKKREENFNNTKAKSGKRIKRQKRVDLSTDNDEKQEDEEQVGSIPSRIRRWLFRCLQSSWCKIIIQVTSQHIFKTVSSVFLGGADYVGLSPEWPFLTHLLNRLQGTQDTSTQTERAASVVEEELYSWLSSCGSLAKDLPPHHLLLPHSHLQPTQITTAGDDRPAERAYYELKTEDQDGVSCLDLQLLYLQEEYGHDHEKVLWQGLTSGLRQARYLTNDEDLPSDLPPELHKYWAQRYRYFTKFDQGIKLDHESWFSVTPEVLAMHHASRCQCDTVIDAFCGAGGNAIQLALTCHNVIAIDIDPTKIELARHNAAVYEVSHRIQFIVGDFFQLATSLKADAILMSPPWGGVNYLGSPVYDVMALGGNMRCDHLINVARSITPNIAIYLPRNSNIYQILELAEPGGSLDIESNWMGRKKKALTVYFGSLVANNY